MVAVVLVFFVRGLARFFWTTTFFCLLLRKNEHFNLVSYENDLKAASLSGQGDLDEIKL